MAKEKPRSGKGRKQPRRRDGGIHYSNTYSLTSWFLDAARHQLDLEAEAPKETALHGENIIRRISAVLFAAAAFESWENWMWDEVTRGDGGLKIVDFDGRLLRGVGKGLFQSLYWKDRLRLVTLLWSPGNRWVLAHDVFAALEDVRELRNALVHPKAQVDEVEGDLATAAFSVKTRQHARFDPAERTDLPELLREKLEVQKLRKFIDVVEVSIQRLRSLKDLPAGAGEKSLVHELGEDGGTCWLDHEVEDVEAPDGAQVKWCSVTRKYVLHRFVVLRKFGRFGEPEGDGVQPVEGTRVCSVMMKCQHVQKCAWPEIRTAQEAQARKNDQNAMRRARGLPPIE